ncbi:RICIN domain-containing protein [Streptomyces sp. NBC_00513]|uniref:RICIN domain-containing protein n=1 Tax=unclassified Streptomyces TaxID=2593676 RepID=UPI00225ACE33|nr:RICIN domain-containing protein [Streptomyces sp. NBC_00424]MCX5079326.1 RICIN domain-containing protein [Streptomyces sp. NBC_00424]WUD39229.1 RICIN domain-containing protein [Streptomyces sp. NBC_00513]
MSRIIRAALAASATVAVLAGTATAVHAEGSIDGRTASGDAAAAAREAALNAATAAQEARSRAGMPQTVIQLTASHSGKCLDVEAGKTTNGIHVQQHTCGGTTAQQWTAVATAGGSFELRSVLSGKCLEVENAGTKPGSVIQQWACAGKDHQRWQLMLIDPVRKLYELQPAHADGMCLDVPGAKEDDGIDTQLYTCNRTAAQLWQVQQVA